MTNKFRDVSNEIKNRKDCVGGNWGIIKQALEGMAELQDDAETIKALDEVIKEFEEWMGCMVAEAPLNEYRKKDSWLKDGAKGYSEKVIRMNRHITSARPVIKKLAQLVKEGE